MLPKKNRLLLLKDFEEIRRASYFFSSGCIALKTKKNTVQVSRFGFSIGIKFSSKAVERNRLKRQLREIIRKNINRIKTGQDMVIFVNKTKEKEFSSEKLETDLFSALKKARLIISIK
ncbi:MAG: ribonuclease P protein component [Candidatus Moranbacteria bacterium CG23_combo_of_CG06-09_8_20_14_all_35_22]|nr:MAG: ribonuclease P protein component [Candidatus Moranbacteria bacterium CG23_combo_of_CG06-09_8_20_14_all_35_22]